MTSQAGLQSAVDAARKYLFSQQHEDGYWCGELEADATLEADYIILHTLLGTEKTERIRKARELHSPAPKRRRRMEHLQAAGLPTSAHR